ncbi:esterase-like activity of phytase family protein [Streptomyces sp. LX-29]|uniref:esterase-like activity of phytase family protein n=1 Tax=Streptomyces sp. LX-29 TaxID=2900152 RepID=UPI00240CEE32|nr:esterase-like activity of phytase family protein [Streptomyces sp. LX-29]WFB09412.1 esterase-like activity of phytase family protein [Streptomyces sp. LX-29]
MRSRRTRRTRHAQALTRTLTTLARPRASLAATAAMLVAAACLAAPDGAARAQGHAPQAQAQGRTSEWARSRTSEWAQGHASEWGQGPGPSRACSPRVSIEGFSDALDKGDHDGVFTGNLSALAVDRDGTLAALSDRSVLFGLTLRDGVPRTTGAVRLADEQGAALDAEGLAVERSGARLVAAEGEPAVRRYDRDGTLRGRLPVPAALRVAPAGRARSNQTFEGLTLRPGGATLIAAMEGQLSGDGADAEGRPLLRLQTWQRERWHRDDFRLGAQWGYPVDAGLGVSEIAAAPGGRLLVLERGFTAGVGNTVRLYLADPRRAGDVGGVENLTASSGARFVRKSLLADLVDCPSLGASAKQPQPNPLLDNIEGMAVLGPARGGRLRVLLVSDDNESARQTTRFYSLTVAARP